MKILFKIFPQDSHFNATIPIARRLQQLGCEVIYAAYEERRASVESQGFQFHSQETDLLPRLVPPVPGSKQPSALQLALYTFINRPRVIADIIPSDGFDSLLQETRPDAILVDSPYARYAVALFKHRIPLGILESMVRLDRRRGVPPLSSDFVPRPTKFARAWSTLLWARYQAGLSAMQAFGMYPLPSRGHIAKVLLKNKTPNVSVNFRRYFHIGISSCPEYILSPREFDFPGEIEPNQFYIGPSVDLHRKETGYDYFFHERLQPFLEKRKAGIPLVYCSLGSAAWRYGRIERFFHKAIEAARGQRFSFVLTIGQELDLRIFPRLPDNVIIFQRVPQLEILKNSDAVITHGGMNTIAECILLKVPMLVYPGSAELDQPGNAARVVYHHVGLKGSLKNETSRGIRSKLQRLLHDPTYRRCVSALADRITASSAYTRGAEILLEQLQAQPCNVLI